MIVDAMSKYEVMTQLRNEFDEEILPYYYKKILPLLKVQLQQRCQRENRTITIGWDVVISKSLNTFKILKRGNKYGYMPIFIAEFRWNNKLCFAYFAPEKNVVVYQDHSLIRYSERILKKKSDASTVFYDYIVKHHYGAFRIVLPTRTHKYSVYFGLAKALFLGDFDDSQPKVNFIWLNTCISYNEARYSQFRIMQSLHEMQNFIENVGDFSDVQNKKQLQDYLKKNRDNVDKIEAVERFLTQYYLLLQLHLSFNFPFTDIFREEINHQLEFIKSFLIEININPHSLSPYSKKHGIVWKGEIDYIENQD